MILYRNNVVVTRIMRRDMLMDNWQVEKYIFWQVEKCLSNCVSYSSCNIVTTSTNLQFLQHHCDINKYDFFGLMRDQNIQRKKCDDSLCLCDLPNSTPFLPNYASPYCYFGYCQVNFTNISLVHIAKLLKFLITKAMFPSNHKVQSVTPHCQIAKCTSPCGLPE